MHRRDPRFFTHENLCGECFSNLDLVLELPSKHRCFSDFLRSRKTADEEVYALIKVSRSIENPHRNRAQSLLKGVVKFRTKMHWPRTAGPLGVVPLCQPQFNSDSFGLREMAETPYSRLQMLMSCSQEQPPGGTPSE